MTQPPNDPPSPEPISDWAAWSAEQHRALHPDVDALKADFQRRASDHAYQAGVPTYPQAPAALTDDEQALVDRITAYLKLNGVYNMPKGTSDLMDCLRIIERLTSAPDADQDADV